MRTLDINNIQIEIENDNLINDSEQLSADFIKRLEQLSMRLEQYTSTEELWLQSKKAQSLNNISTPTGEGAATSIPMSAPNSFVASTTSSVSEGSTPAFSAPTGGGVSDVSEPATVATTSSNNTTPSVSEAERPATKSDSVNESIQPYANVATQESISLPKHLQENTGEPTLGQVKEEVRKKISEAKDDKTINYWTDVLTKLEKGATIADFKDDLLFKEMYNGLKLTTEKATSFNWETTRSKMIAAIDNKILNGEISDLAKSHWLVIRKQLENENVNIANLFEEYDELFLLLREVEGLTELPSKITFFTKTKVYPNLSADKMYATIGTNDVYTFLKTVSIGAGVNKGAVFIKNSNLKVFVEGESLDFTINETLINESKFKKENINWVVYFNNKKEKVFVNEGISLSYNFGKAGKYIIEAYGKTAGANSKKSKNKSAFVELEVMQQEVEITAPTNFSAEYARPFTTEQQFRVKLKANKNAKPLNPIPLYYQIAHTKEKQVITTPPMQLAENGKFNLALPELGTYTIIVTSNGQYPISGSTKFKIINNYVSSIKATKNKKDGHVYLKQENAQNVTFAVAQFKINPPTIDELKNVKWMVYNEKGNAVVPTRLEMKTDPSTPKSPFMGKGETFPFELPKTEGKYFVEAYSNLREGKKSKSSQQIQIVHPTVTEANWTDASGTPKTTSGFIGETNYVKATIPNFCDKEVRIFFHVKGQKATYFKKTEYYIVTKTNSEGKINAAVNFSKDMKTKLGITDWNVNLKFALVGVVDNQLYAFKGISYPVSNSELKVTTKKQILDVYFKYQDKRLLTTDRVPYGAKATNLIILAKTQNMVGDTIKFKVHQLNKDSILEDKTAVKVGANGFAALNFTVFNEDKLKKGTTVTYFAGVEGYTTKAIQNKTLVLEVGAKWEQASSYIDKNDPQLVWGSKVSKEFRLKLLKMCSELWGESRKYEMADAMMISMSVETGETFSSSVIINNNQPISKEEHKKNPNLVKGKPVGLVQFTTAPIKSLILQEKGLKESEDNLDAITVDEINKYKQKLALLSPVEQLDYVKKYFMLYDIYKKVRRPEDIYIIIFAPRATGKGDNVDIYKKYLDGKINPSYSKNSGMDTKNDGFNKGNNDEIIQSGELLARYREKKNKGIRYALSYNETRKLNQVLAEKIIKEKRITFSKTHVRNVIDNAMAIDNIKDTSEGKKAKRSDYDKAPGGEIELLSEMLYIMYMMSKDYKFNVSEIAGASHSFGSKHYLGKAFDVNEINGKDVGQGNKCFLAKDFCITFEKFILGLGAKGVLRPYRDKDHDNHFHISI